MGNRTIIYDQEQARDFDVLNAWRDALIAEGYLEQDLTGGPITTVSGFTVLASSPASLIINLAAGRIYQQAEVDATQYGSLPSDTDLIMQQGYASPQSLQFNTAGLAAGQSRWALVQVAYVQNDIVRANDPTGGILYYWNAANPTTPFQGPNGNGETQPTERAGIANIQVLYGTPATTSSEVPPTPSNGYVPLYLIDLAFGQTTITQGEIITAGPSVGINVPSNYAYAPFMAGLLNSHHNGTTGQAPKIKLGEIANISSANSGGGVSTTYAYAGNPNGHVAGAAAVDGVSPPDFCIDTTNNIMYFCSVSGNAAAAVWTQTSGVGVSFVGGASTGTANAQVVTPVTPGGFALVSGYSVTFTPGTTNTGATTLAVSGTAVTACRKNSGGSLIAFSGNEFTATDPVTVVYNGTYWVLQTSPLGALASLNLGQWMKNDGAGNLTLKVNSATLGDDGSGNLTVNGALGGVLGGTLPNPTMAAGAALANLGFAPIQQGGGASQLTTKLYIGVDSNGIPRAQAGSTDLGEFLMASMLANSLGNSLNASGYAWINGLLIQWQQVTLPLSLLSYEFSFPIAFPHNTFAFFTQLSGQNFNYGGPTGGGIISLSQFTVNVYPLNQSTTNYTCYVFSIGN
jgi:hypothetical protein